ncbi:MAG: hypothetical protein N3F03_04620 [Ignavibacteria bacterium]|nr:hypothetical protein [Ignavibacteria bacterium]
MNSSQLILLFAALIVLSSSIILVNRASIENTDERQKAKNQLQLIIEAKNLFEEIKTKNFDEKVISMVSLNRDSLTRPINFGTEGESYPNFDDIDDYHNFTRDIQLENKTQFRIRVIVQYLNENDQNLISSSPTFLKMVKVICQDNFQNKLFELNQIFSIW